MSEKITSASEKARVENGKNVMNLGEIYSQVSVKQLLDCEDKHSGYCERCKTTCDNLHFFGVAFKIVGAAAINDKAAALFDVLTKFAIEHLPEFPPELREPLYSSDFDFPEIIEEPEANNGA